MVFICPILERGRVSEQLIGDGLVPLDSALGKSKVAARCLDIPIRHQWVGLETGHNELLSHPEVYAQLRDWLVYRGQSQVPE